MVNRKKEVPPQAAEETKEIPLSKRPFTSLTPSSDGHWLKLEISNLQIEAETLDYELLYTLPDGRTQGVPGTIKLTAEKKIERDLLLGSESSGKFRYDEGVKEGSLTLRFRDSGGKLIAKFATNFSLLTKTDTLAATDAEFKYILPKTSKEFFVVMQTFGLPNDTEFEVKNGPYGIFTSSKAAFPGTVEMGGGEIYFRDRSNWKKLVDYKSSDIGIFVGVI